MFNCLVRGTMRNADISYPNANFNTVLFQGEKNIAFVQFLVRFFSFVEW